MANYDFIVFRISLTYTLGPFSSTNKTDRHDITQKLVKVALNTITLTPFILDEYVLPSFIFFRFCMWYEINLYIFERIWINYTLYNLNTLCEVNSRKCGHMLVTRGHRKLQVKGSHFLLSTSQRVIINCFIITLYPLCCKIIREPSNTNFKVYFERTWTE